jgi:hypothetical protein
VTKFYTIRDIVNVSNVQELRMTQLVRNVGTMAMQVKIIRADGTKGSFRLMPKNKGVPLAPGVTIDPYWKEMKGKYLRIFDVQKPVAQSNPASQSPKVASSANGSTEVKATVSTASVKEA